MSTSEIYKQALREFVSARRRLSQAVSTLRQVTDVLKDWEKANPEYVNGVLDQAVAEMPTTQVMVAAIAAWKETSLRVKRAWESVTPDEKIGMMPPSKFEPPVAGES